MSINKRIKNILIDMELGLPMYNAYPYFSLKNLGKKNAYYIRQNTVAGQTTLQEPDKPQQPSQRRHREQCLCRVKHTQPARAGRGSTPHLLLRSLPEGARVPQLQVLAALSQWHLLAPRGWECSLPETVGSGSVLHCHRGLAPQSHPLGNQ